MSSQPVAGTLYAFDAAGTTSCGGAPKVCAPLWTATLPGLWSNSPTVAGGVVYVTTKDGTLAAFDASGTTGCAGSPKVCTPLWRAHAGTTVWSAATVADHRVFVVSASSGSTLYAFDASGSAGCGGAPKVCAPVWTGPLTNGSYAAPVAAGGMVFAAAQDGGLAGFDAAGSRGCSGAPKVCAPLWTATVGPVTRTGLAVADGVLYVGSYDKRLYALDTTGTHHCTAGTPVTCTPLWTATFGHPLELAPTVANGVVYFGEPGGDLQAFDARGSTGCSGTPKVCTPLAGVAVGGLSTSATVANGTVYAGSADRHLYALRLRPAA